MRIKLQHSHVMFDVDSSEVRLLANDSKRSIRREGNRASPAKHNCISILPGLAVAAVEEQTSYAEQINQRANEQTHGIEEILSHHYGHPC